MPAAKRTAPSKRRSSAFKEPAALRRLNKSLETARDAVAELRKSGGRDVSQGARDIYKDLHTFVSNARRDSGKLGKALARDFEQAQKRMAQPTSATSSRTRSSGTASRRSRPAAKRRPAR